MGCQRAVNGLSTGLSTAVNELSTGLSTAVNGLPTGSQRAVSASEPLSATAAAGVASTCYTKRRGECAIHNVLHVIHVIHVIHVLQTCLRGKSHQGSKGAMITTMHHHAPPAHHHAPPCTTMHHPAPPCTNTTTHDHAPPRTTKRHHAPPRVTTTHPVSPRTDHCDAQPPRRVARWRSLRSSSRPFYRTTIKRASQRGEAPSNERPREERHHQTSVQGLRPLIRDCDP